MKNKFFKQLFKHRKIPFFKPKNIFWKSGYRKDLGFSVRSAWEANYIRFLQYCDYEVKYEPRMFPLSTGQHYMPDFYLPQLNMYIELKGAELIKGMNKFHRFIKEYPEINIKFVDSLEYKQIEKEFKEKVPNWE